MNKKPLIKNKSKKLERLTGIHDGLRGDVSGLRGDVSGLHGNVSSALRGNVSGLHGEVDYKLCGNCSCLIGDCTGITGNLDEITQEQRLKNSNIESYCDEENQDDGEG